MKKTFAVVKKVLLAAVVVVAVAGIGRNAFAGLAARGATDVSHGNYPIWYQDSNGLALEHCIVDGAQCLNAPEARPNPAAPLNITSVPPNWPAEMFFWTAVSSAGWTINGDLALAVLALESSFSIGQPQDGDQVVFARVRVKLLNPPLTGTYTFQHPWGQFNFDCTAGVVCVSTRDVGLAPLQFDLALGGDVGPFLRPSVSEGGAASAPVAGVGGLYISDAVTEGFVTGGSVRNRVVVIDPLGNQFAQNRFSVMGKIIGVSTSPANAVFAPQAPGAVSQTVMFTLTNLDPAQNLVLGALSLTGANPADFQVTLNACSNATIAPQGTCTFHVAMSGAAGANPLRSATARISAISPANTPAVAIPLSGEINASMPTIVSQVPSNGAVNVVLNQKIVIRFNEALSAASVTNASIFIAGGVPATVSLDATGKIIIMTPLDDLAPNTPYTVNITNAVEDVAGNPAQATSFVFTTGATTDSTLPAVSVASPNDGTTGASLLSALTVVFSKPMDLTTISNATFKLDNGATGTVTFDEAARLATFTPETPLLANTVYTATITTGASDTTGNNMSADFNWTFLSDISPTTPVLVGPLDAESGIGTSVELKWRASSDEDGDAIVYHVSICDNAQFVGCQPIDKVAQASINENVKFALVGGSGLSLMLVGTLFMGSVRYRKRFIALLVAAYVGGVFIASCGSSGNETAVGDSSIASGSDQSSTADDGTAGGTTDGTGGTDTGTVPTVSKDVTLFVDGLKAGKTYTWKVEADDSKGGKAVSTTWQFKTAQ